MWIGRAAGDIDVNGEDLVHTAETGVILSKDAAATTARTHGDDEARRGHRVVGLAQRDFHIPRNRAGHQQHIGVSGRRDEMNPKSFDVVHGTVEANDFYLATVARTRIHFPDVQRTAQDFIDSLLQLAASGFD